MDRPDTFISIGDSDDELGRLLGCLRFWFTKDLVWAVVALDRAAVDCGLEICQGQAMQALQLNAGRVLQGMFC